MKNILITNWGISSELIKQEAEKQNYKVKIISKENNLYSINNWKKTNYFKSVDCWLNTAFWLKIANNKQLTYMLAEQENIKVPKSIYIDKNDLENLDLNSLNIDFPVITKPVDWAHWDWVAINLKNIEDLEKWLKYSFEDKSVNKVIIQDQIFWEDHRLIVINWKLEAATKRIAPFVIGNWNNTIQELIDIENNNPLRWWGSDHDAPMSKIKIDSEAISYIKEQWYKLDSILEKDKKIKVRKNENLSTGWLAIDVTDKVHPEIKTEAEKMAKLAWLWFCWVDFFCEDISLWLQEWKWAIIEINATPGIRMHHFPSIWKPRNIAKKILEAVF